MIYERNTSIAEGAFKWVDVPGKGRKMKNIINFYDGFIQDDIIWFSSLNHNALMTLDIKSGRIDSIGAFPGCRSYQKNLHIRVIEHNKCLYFIPRNGNFIHVFNLEQMAFKDNVPLPYAENTCIANAFIDSNGKIWIIPAYFCKGIVVLDTYSATVEMIRSAETSDIPPDAFIGPNCVCYSTDTISMCILKNNTLIYIDTLTNKVSYEKLDEGYMPYSFISEDGETFYISNYPNNEIVSWNKNNKTYHVLSDKMSSEFCMYMYWNCIHKDHKLMCLPYDKEDLLIVDQTEKNDRHVSICELVKKNSCNPMYSFYKEYKGHLYLFPSGADGILIIDCENWSIRSLEYVISEYLQEQIQTECKIDFLNEVRSGVVEESIEYKETLDEFLNVVTQNWKNKSSMDRMDIGNEIYKTIKKIII